MDDFEALALGLALMGAAEETVSTHECPRCCEICSCETEEGCTHVCDEEDHPLGIHGTGDPNEMEHSQHGYRQ